VKYETCPECGGHLLDCFQRGHKLQQECGVCDWEGEVRTPEQRAIQSTCEIEVSYSGGFVFTVFDRFGHGILSSRSYATAELARVDIKRELERGRGVVAGPYTAVLWPASVTVEGEVIE
jgi:hypothetical protein